MKSGMRTVLLAGWLLSSVTFASSALAQPSGQPPIAGPNQPPIAGPAPSGATIIVVPTAPENQANQAPAEAPPPVGSLDDADLDAYLERLHRPIDDLKARLRGARDEGEREQIREALRVADQRYKSERDRLTTHDAGLIAGGGAMIGLGSASLVSSIVLGIVYGIESISFFGTAHPDPGVGTAALACLGAGIALEGAGIPMLAVGVSHREPRTPEGAFEPPVRAPIAGATLIIPF